MITNAEILHVPNAERVVAPTFSRSVLPLRQPTPAHIPDLLDEDGTSISAALLTAGLCPVALRDLESAAIQNALQHAGGNRTHAAKSLGISVRTLQRKLREWACKDGSAES